MRREDETRGWRFPGKTGSDVCLGRVGGRPHNLVERPQITNTFSYIYRYRIPGHKNRTWKKNIIMTSRRNILYQPNRKSEYRIETQTHHHLSHHRIHNDANFSVSALMFLTIQGHVTTTNNNVVTGTVELHHQMNPSPHVITPWCFARQRSF
jgi:hypothetical protein